MTDSRSSWLDLGSANCFPIWCLQFLVTHWPTCNLFNIKWTQLNSWALRFYLYFCCNPAKVIVVFLLQIEILIKPCYGFKTNVTESGLIGLNWESIHESVQSTYGVRWELCSTVSLGIRLLLKCIFVQYWLNEWHFTVNLFLTLNIWLYPLRCGENISRSFLTLEWHG